MKLKTNYGMVVSGHREATKSGIKILKNGGNGTGKMTERSLLQKKNTLKSPITLIMI